MGQHHHGVAGAEGPTVDHAGVAAPTAGPAQDPLHRQPRSAPDPPPVPGRPAPRVGRLQRVEHGGPVVPGRGVRAVDHVVAVQGRDGDDGARGDPEAQGQRLHFVHDALIARAVPPDQVHFVGADDELVHAQQGGDADMAARLLAQAGGRIHQHQGQVRRRGSGRHVPGVLDVPGAVGDDELAVGCRGVAVRHVDRDALLALGAQSVGDERQIDLSQPAAFRCVLDGGELVVEELAGVEEQAPDQGALPVVDRADGREAQKIHGVRGELAGRRRAGQCGHGARSNPRACGPPWRSRRTDRQPGSPPVRRSGRPTPRG